MFRLRRRKEAPVPPAEPSEPFFTTPDPSKYELPRGPRPLELKRRGLLNIEDYIPDNDGNKRRQG